jgi:hypothetical protein
VPARSTLLSILLGATGALAVCASATGVAWAQAVAATDAPPTTAPTAQPEPADAEGDAATDAAAEDAAEVPEAAPSTTQVAAPVSNDFGPAINPFRCRGEAEAITRDLRTSEIHTEIERRLARPYEDNDPPTIVALKLCVIAELKRRVGAGDAAEWYEKAIERNPDEPGYELWYGSYLGQVRGAGGPLIEGAEKHYYRGVAKLEAKKKAGKAVDYDEITGEWLQRRLMDLYQRDGQPITGWKAYRYDPGDTYMPGLMLSSTFQTSADTRDFYYGNEMRLFTGELLFAQSALRRNDELENSEKFNLIRAPLRIGWNSKLRLRQNWLGALDFEYRYFKAYDSQIDEFNNPDVRVDVTVSEFGLGYSRVIPVWKLFDFNLSGGVRLTDRTGTVEFEDKLTQEFPTVELTPGIARFVGPDKISLRGAYVWMGLDDIEGGMESDRARGQTIRAAHLEYAMYRPVTLPTLKGGLRFERGYTRGWHFYTGAAEEVSVYGVRKVTTRDYYGGTTLKGYGAYDVTLQGTYYTGRTAVAPMLTPGRFGPVEIDESQSHSQYRTTFALARRLIDEDVTPGMPKTFGGFAATSLVLVVPISHDLGLAGPKLYENVRAGAELWLKLVAPGLGGTTFLLTGGYDYQYFYDQTKAMHMGHLALRMGF